MLSGQQTNANDNPLFHSQVEDPPLQRTQSMRFEALQQSAIINDPLQAFNVSSQNQANQVIFMNWSFRTVQTHIHLDSTWIFSVFSEENEWNAQGQGDWGEQKASRIIAKNLHDHKDTRHSEWSEGVCA